MLRKWIAVAWIGLFLVAAAPPPYWSEKGVVSADHVLASEAGATILRQGGNAVDAAVATALAAGVVQPSSSGLGGGGFAVYGSSPDAMKALDFREVAPGKAHPGLFLDGKGDVVPNASTKGGLAVAVPGEGRGLAYLLRTAGTMSFEAVAAPAIQLAEEGFEVGEFLVRAAHKRPVPGLFEAGVPGRGRLIRRPRLAKTLRAWADSEGEALYEGKIAKDIVGAAKAAGGILSRKDLAQYRPVDRKVLVGQYRGYTVATMAPPSSGGAVLLQVLSVLESQDLSSLGHNSSAHIHLLVESFQHAYADRAAVMGDPAFSEVPIEPMLARERIEAIRAQFDPEKTFERHQYGGDFGLPEDGGTHHLSVLDADGMAVALTTTINTSFGSEVVAPMSGVLLNNEMDDFVAKPGVPNAFGLIGREANSVEPGKKPLSSMTPTVLFKDGEAVLVLGASGGPFIISSTLQVLSNIVDFGMDAEEAVSRPRVHHQWVPEHIFVDDGIPQDVVDGLKRRGHAIRQMPFFSSVQIIHKKEGVLYGASDPRKGGRPAGGGP